MKGCEYAINHAHTCFAHADALNVYIFVFCFAVCAASQSAVGGEPREVKGHPGAGVNNFFKRLGGREGSLRESLTALMNGKKKWPQVCHIGRHQTPVSACTWGQQSSGGGRGDLYSGVGIETSL